jgi:hypothetical protein
MTENQQIKNEDQRIIDELKEVIHKAAFLVAFDKKDGKPIAVIAGKDCSVLREGRLPVPSEVIAQLLEKHGKENLETISYTFNHVYGSPGCYIPTGRGGWKCICCS